MSGSYWLLDTPTDERSIELTLEAYADDIRRLPIDKTFRLRGRVEAENLASGQDLHGTLIFKLIDEGRVQYRLFFAGDDARRYDLSGQKEWIGLAPLDSLTLLQASLYDDSGQEVGRVTLRFDWRADAARSIKSFRLHFSEQARVGGSLGRWRKPWKHPR
jgi:hypothetical protein